MNEETLATLQADQIARLRDVVAEQPQTIGDYEIECQLGEGGFGVVYRATQQRPVRRTVALKLLKRGMDSMAILRRFELERQALASMNHPGVAAVFDAGVSDDGQHYFVMEYVDGAPITAWANEGTLSVRERLLLIGQVCDAITHAHQKGVIHRDIKPSNVLVTRVDGSPQVKVIDFGIAKALAEGPLAASEITQQAMLVGTPEYMSPEQASGQLMPVDTRTDVYALGVLLYELLTGHLPFDSGTLRSAPIDEVYRVIREQDPPRPSTRLSRADETTVKSVATQRRTEPLSLIRQLRGELEWIPLKAMRKAPDERYQSPAAMRDDIDRYLNSEPLVAGPTTAGYRVRKFLRKHRWPVAAACAIFLSLVAGAIGTSVMAIRASAARDDAIHQQGLAEDAKVVADEARDEAIRQQGLAEDAEAVAAAMNDFLVDLLHQATPRFARGKEIPVSDVVELALESLDEKFPDQPRVRLKLRMVLSGILSDLGRTPEAAVDVRSAVEQSKEILGPDDEVTLGLLNELASMEADTGNLAVAAEVYRDLLERCERILGPNENRTLVVVNDLATTLKDIGQFDEAEKLYRRALDGRSRLFGPHDYATLQSMLALANLLDIKGEFDQAFELSRETHQLCIQHLGEDHPDTINAAEAYAGMLWSAEDFEPAEQMFREIVARRTEMYGATHPETLNAMTNLALVLDGQDRSDEAEPLLRVAFDEYRKLYGMANPVTIIVANNLATVLESVDRQDEAATLYLELMEACRQTVGEAHHFSIMLAANLGALRRTQGRFAEAEQVLTRAYEVAKKERGADDQFTKLVAEELELLREDRDAEQQRTDSSPDA